MRISIFYLQKVNSSVKIRPVEKKRQGGAIMAKCAVCEKGAYFGNNVSHSHRRSNKMWKSNVKSVRVKTATGGAQKMYVCTSCLRSGKVGRLIPCLYSLQKAEKHHLLSALICKTYGIRTEDKVRRK